MGPEKRMKPYRIGLGSSKRVDPWDRTLTHLRNPLCRVWGEKERVRIIELGLEFGVGSRTQEK